MDWFCVEVVKDMWGEFDYFFILLLVVIVCLLILFKLCNLCDDCILFEEVWD